MNVSCHLFKSSPDQAVVGKAVNEVIKDRLTKKTLIIEHLQ